MNTPIIQTEGISKRYRLGLPASRGLLRDSLARTLRSPLSVLRRGNEETFWALKDVSLEVQVGEVLGLIGRNGSGKTTLLKVLSRITQPTSGWAVIRGRVGSLLEVGTGFHPELTGRENTYLSGAILGMGKQEIARKFDEIVSFAELDKFIDTPVKHYSSGMYVRLAFAVAAHLEPEILLVDEVLAVGDARFQKKCLGKMSDVARGGRTIVFISHNMSAILHLCSRAILLENGQVRASAQVNEVVGEYLRLMESADGSDLSQTTDRHGRGIVRFERAWFEDESGGVVDHAISGKRLAIVTQYRSRFTDDLQNSRVSVGFEDMLGQPLFVCSTEVVAGHLRKLPPQGVVRCIIPELPLSQGQYRLTLFMEVDHEIEDWLAGIVPLNVIDGDFFGSGRQYPDGWQGKGVLVRHTWQVD